MRNINLYYFKRKHGNGNFGDELNTFIPSKLFNVKIEKAKEGHCEAIFIGSILSIALTKYSHQNQLPLKVWGSGFIKGINKNSALERDIVIYALRGKKTLADIEKLTGRKYVNVPLGDPGLLISKCYDEDDLDFTKKYDYGIIPHHVDKDDENLNKIKLPNSIFIDINDPIDVIVKQIVSCKCIISSAMHGLIAADAFGIPNRRFIASYKLTGGEYKFDDYYSAFDIEQPEPIDLRTLDVLDHIDFMYQADETKVKKIQNNLIEAFPYPKPKVSVILPSYNVGPYINKCMNSLLNQTLRNIEFIFVDDGSTDDTYNQIIKYKDPRIKVIRHEKNMYTAEARNTGIENADGEYLYFMDPDDYIDKDFLEKLYTLAKENDADIAKGILKTIPNNIMRNNNAKINDNKFNFHFNHVTAIYRKSLFDKYKIRFFIDVICGQFPLVYYANKIVTRDDAVYYYVKREGSCVNSQFTIEKWRKLNIRGAVATLNFMNNHEMKKEDYLLVVTSLIFNLYQYGYRRLTDADKEKAKPLLNMYLDDFWMNVKYKDDENLNKLYLEMRSKYE